MEHPKKKLLLLKYSGFYAFTACTATTVATIHFGVFLDFLDLNIWVNPGDPTILWSFPPHASALHIVLWKSFQYSFFHLIMENLNSEKHVLFTSPVVYLVAPFRQINSTVRCRCRQRSTKLDLSTLNWRIITWAFHINCNKGFFFV